jgi:hypothetical protein
VREPLPLLLLPPLPAPLGMRQAQFQVEAKNASHLVWVKNQLKNLVHPLRIVVVKPARTVKNSAKPVVAVSKFGKTRQM